MSKSIIYNGKKYSSQRELCKEYGISEERFSQRINISGWSVEKAIETELHGIDLSNKDYGYFHVIELDKNHDRNKRRIWKCQCRCGKIVYLPTSKILSGDTKSCGCIVNDMVHKSMRKNSNGICYEKETNKYRARITRYNKTYHLGRFDKIEDAQNIIKIAKTFRSIDNFLQWISIKKNILYTLNTLCQKYSIDSTIITQIIFDSDYEELYFNKADLESFIKDFVETIKE